MRKPSVALFGCLLAVAAASCTRAIPTVQVAPPTPAQIPLTIPPAPEPTGLEAFAYRPTAIVTWASPVGRLESDEARAIVTAFALEDRESAETARGLRIDLVHLHPPDSCSLIFLAQSRLCASANAAIYFGEEDLQRVRDGVAHGNFDNLIVSYFVTRQRMRRVGLLVGGYDFIDHDRSDLVTLIERGMTTFTTTSAVAHP